MEQLTISGKLYGREREIVTLLESYRRISRGHGEVLLVPGYSGAGKTSLVRELRAPVLDSNGYRAATGGSGGGHRARYWD